MPPVSYTHLDVYKRQLPLMAERHQILPGIGDGGHTRVGDQNGGLPCQQAGADLFAPFPPVVLKICLLYTSRCV